MFWHNFINFFNSSFFIAVTTLAVGTFAYRVYRRQKRDDKSDAAKVMLLEIEGAEQTLQSQRINETQPFTPSGEEDLYLMPLASWGKYKYLFVRNFDRNEWDKISDFYLRCQVYDEAVRFQVSVVKKNQEELRFNVQRILADYADKYIRSLKGKSTIQQVQLEQDYIAERKLFTDTYVNTQPTHMFTYIPVMPYNDAIRALKGLDKSISLTSIGIKLKHIAYKKSTWQQFKDHIVGVQNN